MKKYSYREQVDKAKELINYPFKKGLENALECAKRYVMCLGTDIYDKDFYKNKDNIDKINLDKKELFDLIKEKKSEMK